jgi:protein MpaA
MIFGGFHGDEPKSVFVANCLIELLSTSPASAGKATWIIVPLVNPDGYERRKRRNARGVDINRNFPTRNRQSGSRRSRMFGGPLPASEPETRAVMRIIERYQPDRIVTIHSIGLARFCNNYDGPARAIANAMSRRNGYPVTVNIGYPTPGSFGTWAGVERRIPVVTLELPSTASPQRCWVDNRDALLCLG